MLNKLNDQVNLKTSEQAAVKIAVAGAQGRVGRLLIETILASSKYKLVGALVHPDEGSSIGQDAAYFLGKKSGVLITSSIDEALKNAEVLIDFTTAQATITHLMFAAQHNVNMVIGTTGFSSTEKEKIQLTSQKIAVVFSPNMSVSVNLFFKLLMTAGLLLKEGYDIEIQEAHHNKKIDAPSGTALKMGEILASSRQTNLKDCAVFTRHGLIGARKSTEIGFATIRGGNICGDHTALFAGEGSSIEITHRSTNRQSYADGALRAALFLQSKSCGLYDMSDVLFS